MAELTHVCSVLRTVLEQLARQWERGASKPDRITQRDEGKAKAAAIAAALEGEKGRAA